jgi:hypothetical protein
MAIQVRNLRVRLHRPELDARLAAGEDSSAAPELALRATQLEQPAARRQVALALARAVASARGGFALTASVPVSRAAVEEARPELELLVAMLEGDGPVRAQGVARAHQLLTDGASPLYANGNGGLRQAAQSALDALGPGAYEKNPARAER